MWVYRRWPGVQTLRLSGWMSRRVLQTTSMLSILRSPTEPINVIQTWRSFSVRYPIEFYPDSLESILLSLFHMAIHFKENDHWSIDPCTTCVCSRGQVSCQTRVCPRIDCDEERQRKVVPVGECCPQCSDSTLQIGRERTKHFRQKAPKRRGWTL